MKEALANPAIRRILAAAAVSQIGDWAARLAVAFVVLDETGLASGVSVVGALFFLPWLGPGQYLASWGDRLPRVQLLVSCEVLRALLYVLIALAASSAPIWVLLAGVAVVATIDPVWEANRAALLVDVTTKDEYGPAQKMSQTVNQSATLVGWGIGGLLVAGVGTAGTLWINAATFAVSGLLVAGIAGPTQSDRVRRSGSLRAAVGFLRNDRISMIALATTIGLTVPGMAIETQAPVFGRYIGLADQWIGVLAAMVPAVTIVGVLSIPDQWADRRLLSGGFLVAGAAGLVASVSFAVGTHPLAAFAGYAAVGAAFASSSAANIVVGRRLPAEDRASVFAVIQTVVFGALSVGAIVGGPISDVIGPRPANIGLSLVAGTVCFSGLVFTLGGNELR